MRLVFLLELEVGFDRAGLMEESRQLVLVMELFILLLNPEEADFFNLEDASAELDVDRPPICCWAFFIILTNNQIQ